MGEKKKILFVNSSFTYGGIQTALKNLLNSLDYEKYDVDVLVFSDSGIDRADLSDNVRVLYGEKLVKTLERSVGDLLREKKYMQAAFALAARAWTKAFGNTIPVNLALLSQKKLKGYDCAIAYRHERNAKRYTGGYCRFIIHRVQAKKKIGWIHGDYSTLGFTSKHFEKIYNKLDYVVAVSNGCAESFKKALPNVNTPVTYIYNCNNYDKIKEMADQNPVIYDENQINVVTVARLSQEKGLERAIYAIDACVKEGINVHYHLIGGGTLNQKLLSTVNECGLSDHVTLYGPQENPYRYLKNADLFLLTSFHEAAPMVFNEAKALGVPILSTETISAYEMILKCNAGWVCENSESGIKEAIIKTLQNKNEINEKKEKLREQHFGNEESIQMFDEVLNK
ncbi:MAG: glycosyltransferase [Bacillota bacterium]|nr:glycosyltransferase [Bacillota bacterium]